MEWHDKMRGHHAPRETQHSFCDPPCTQHPRTKTYHPIKYYLACNDLLDFMEAEAETAKFLEKISGSGSGSGEKNLEAEAEAFFEKKFQMEAEAEANFF